MAAKRPVVFKKGPGTVCTMQRADPEGAAAPRAEPPLEDLSGPRSAAAEDEDDSWVQVSREDAEIVDYSGPDDSWHRVSPEEASRDVAEIAKSAFRTAVQAAVGSKTTTLVELEEVEIIQPDPARMASLILSELCKKVATPIALTLLGVDVLQEEPGGEAAPLLYFVTDGQEIRKFVRRDPANPGGVAYTLHFTHYQPIMKDGFVFALAATVTVEINGEVRSSWRCLAFRGTSNSSDVYNSWSDIILANVKTNQLINERTGQARRELDMDNQTRLIMTGHSLGGICALWALYKKRWPAQALERRGIVFNAASTIFETFPSPELPKEFTGAESHFRQDDPIYKAAIRGTAGGGRAGTAIYQLLKCHLFVHVPTEPRWNPKIAHKLDMFLLPNSGILTSEFRATEPFVDAL